MTPNETTQLRTMAEMNRRLRRDDENVELFAVVHKNHDRR